VLLRQAIREASREVRVRVAKRGLTGGSRIRDWNPCLARGLHDGVVVIVANELIEHDDGVDAMRADAAGERAERTAAPARLPPLDIRPERGPGPGELAWLGDTADQDDAHRQPSVAWPVGSKGQSLRIAGQCFARATTALNSCSGIQ
jgi:hypothetical protein